MIRTLVVEDSAVEQALLTHILESDPEIKVVGNATDGEQALVAAEELKPDVITMDIHMPRLNGFDTTRRIMETNPVPIIIVSGSYFVNDADKTFRAMEAGALTIVRKPRGVGHPDFQGDAAELIRTVRMMSEIKVVRRWPRPRREPAALPLPVRVGLIATQQIRVVAIGASTGGPAVLQEIFSALPKDLAVPILVVQHMASGFVDNFVKWLSAATGFPARVAIQGEPLTPGQAYFAPDGLHLLVSPDLRVVLSNDPPENGLRPAVSRLFRSVAETFGSRSLGVILTGMGKDGADELKLLKQKGAVTVAQDRESSIIFGMPGEAVRLDAAEFVLAPERIAALLTKLGRAGNSPSRSLPGPAAKAPGGANP